MPDPKNDQPTVLITGAAKRIGRALALDLSARGWRVGVHCNQSGDAAAQTVEDIRDAGATADLLQADLADPDAPAALMRACTEALGQPSCLINNASLFERDRIQDLDLASWNAHIDVNLRAPILLTQAFAHGLADDAPGNVINILDQRVWKLTPDYFSYTVSKSALWTATQTLAQALAPRIRVNAIGPGPALANERQSQAAFARQQAATLLQRGPDLAELCAAVRFILDAPSMTGQMIALDGGQHLAWRTPDVYDDGA